MRQMPRGGRPLGARTKLTQKVLEDILADWRDNGPAAIKAMRIEDPAGYCRVVCSTLPKELTVETVNSDLAELTDEELADAIAHIRSLRATPIDQRPMMIEAKKDSE
jgi:hypothetical protein